MADNIQKHTELMLDILNQIKDYKERKEKFLQELEKTNNLEKKEAILQRKEILKGKTKESWIKGYDDVLANFLKRLEAENQNILDTVELESYITTPEKIKDNIKKKEQREVEIIPPSPEKQPLQYARLNKKQLRRLMEELNITHTEIKIFLKRYKKEKEEKGFVKEEYSVYKPSEVGSFANKFLGDFSIKITKQYSEFFKPLENNLKQVDIKILPKTYVSISLFFTIISFPLFFIILGLLFGSFINGFFLAILGSILTFVSFYFYPASLIGGRRRKIKDDLPFALIHMSAVAGSGARPIDIFDLLIKSGEYRELGKEVNKIMNYVNLFGYDLTTALKNIAKTTPSPEFRELLNGMISTIETGGDLKEYLDGKAQDTMSTYKLERDKYVKTLETYSDIYTTILIAAPLLFIVVLAIINVIGGKLGGFDVGIIALIGTYGFVPLLNIGYIIFLTISQPEL
ncbi:MAG: type II secretion system F family protein [Nanoarchaeota archaeon]|nr:type II secretion system F family protein [Nanoarchaeota archaeon]